MRYVRIGIMEPPRNEGIRPDRLLNLNWHVRQSASSRSLLTSDVIGPLICRAFLPRALTRIPQPGGQSSRDIAAIS
jgi:hypothetical protein